ncbi:alcohol dehydrogenase catalytic domain-containing protein [Lacticaseibacillus daqingensis]|uniref:alcohol dehydrogenase catalytic domain-containing protein n=1 Tax=Lacticaseibacillus daqingensis TaxID=2486014 RepID=UPI000F775A3F|nr:zinc-binding dehydrogenase [Lacticaseibacillus daqingensis]
MPTNLVLVATHGGALTADSFQAQSQPWPTPAPTDLLVQVEGVGLNPVDDKLRASMPANATPRVLGFDAVGTVVAVGDLVPDFTLGDRVIYAGTQKRPGSFQQVQAVRAALCARAPRTLATATLAALPLVGLTAWELLFEKMGFTPAPGANRGQSLLIINGAGGVGTVMSQLADWAGVTVLATASPSHFDWLRTHGVTTPIDRHTDLVAAVAAAGHHFVTGVAILYAPEPYLSVACRLVAPFGHVGTLVTPAGPLAVTALKPKAASLDFEFMFAKSDYDVDVASQGHILSQLVKLVAAGLVDPGVATELSPISPANLVAGFTQLNAGHQHGKIVLTGPVHL